MNSSTPCTIHPSSTGSGPPSNTKPTTLEALTNAVFRGTLEKICENHRRLQIQPPLDQHRKKKIIVEIARGLNHIYLDKVIGQKVAQVLLQKFQSGKYETSNSVPAFVFAVYEDIREACSDKHLGINYTDDPISEHNPYRSLNIIKHEEQTSEQRQAVEFLNKDRPVFSENVESYMIPGTGIGYFKINLFPPTHYPDTKPVIDQAMNHIADAEAMIIDLRNNMGGEPKTVALVASYLYDELHNTQQEDQSNETSLYFTEPKNLSFGGKKPIYVLINERTFSGGEALAYTLQSSGRAFVVGQTTAGGAHATRPFVVDDYIMVSIPFSNLTNPHTGTNWEGTGVKPDLPIAENEDELAATIALIKNLPKR